MVAVTAMGPCPPIEKGKGRVVTMTVTHENSHIFELELSGLDTHGRAITETLCPTDVHKLYSVERSWVMTKNLRVGEVLRTQQGTATITSIKRKAGDYRVYNFEVEATHAYFVGVTRTLSHNVDCPITKPDIAGYLPDKSFKPAGYLPAPQPKPPADTLVVRGGVPSAENIAKSIGPHPEGPFGFSANTAPGKTVEELAVGLPNKKIGVTTLGEIEASGGAVVKTTGKSPFHVTVTDLPAPKAASIFKQRDNPCKQ